MSSGRVLFRMCFSLGIYILGFVELESALREISSNPRGILPAITNASFVGRDVSRNGRRGRGRAYVLHGSASEPLARVNVRPTIRLVQWPRLISKAKVERMERAHIE
jgi:hypothetical protein